MYTSRDDSPLPICVTLKINYFGGGWQVCAPIGRPGARRSRWTMLVKQCNKQTNGSAYPRLVICREHTTSRLLGPLPFGTFNHMIEKVRMKMLNLLGYPALLEREHLVGCTDPSPLFAVKEETHGGAFFWSSRFEHLLGDAMGFVLKRLTGVCKPTWNE